MFPFMIGAELGAELFVVEHRFYGESQPFNSWATPNLRYLTSEQAMADLSGLLYAHGAGPMRKTLVVGGSYPGALAAWFKTRYPHIAFASWASSGVVQPIVDFHAFDEQVWTSSLKSGKFCPLAIQKSTAYITQQGVLRDKGTTDNAIDRFLNSSESSAGMRTDDFMFYYADIFVESV